MNNKHLQHKGFTLVEIMVATSIFMIIMLVAMGALITSSNVAKKSLALRTAMDNVNFSMESMTRSLRTGTQYVCDQSGSISLPGTQPQDCSLNSSNGGIAVIFTPAKQPLDARNAAFQLVDRADGSQALQRCDYDSNTNETECSDLVASNVNIKKLLFFVNGTEANDLIQPSIYIIMQGVVTLKGEETEFALQTMVSQRSAE